MKIKMLTRILLVSLVVCLGFSQNSKAAADNQAFAGFGTGFEMTLNDGSGIGFYFKAEGGYAFNKTWGAGLHVGFSRIGGAGLRVLDFGAFGQALDDKSGVYARFYLDAVHARTTAGEKFGISGSETGIAFGAGLGMLLPAEGDLHFAPELSYKPAFFGGSSVHLLSGTVSLIWDL